ncbi:hypothetical protein Ciccas_013963 [Cichlidogyrus casuarinus]|uniref:Uncharacterized protein n=1 Tax=Cichlidogyrus casuarinus TaxID=1844966 RepID=A0ABD2PJ97_9PLAT
MSKNGEDDSGQGKTIFEVKPSEPDANSEEEPIRRDSTCTDEPGAHLRSLKFRNMDASNRATIHGTSSKFFRSKSPSPLGLRRSHHTSETNGMHHLVPPSQGMFSRKRQGSNCSQLSADRISMLSAVSYTNYYKSSVDLG